MHELYIFNLQRVKLILILFSYYIDYSKYYTNFYKALILLIINVAWYIYKNIDIKEIFSRIFEKTQNGRGIVIPNKIIRARQLPTGKFVSKFSIHNIFVFL